MKANDSSTVATSDLLDLIESDVFDAAARLKDMGTAVADPVDPHGRSSSGDERKPR